MISIPLGAFANIEIITLSPNPPGDDTLGEYIEIRNISCEARDISGYQLQDLQRSFVFVTGTILESHSGRIFPYSETKISLNNSGIETLTIRDQSGTIIDTVTYSWVQGEGNILIIAYEDIVCDTEDSHSGILLDATGSTENARDNSGSLAGWTGDIIVSWEIIIWTGILTQSGESVSLIGSGILSDTTMTGNISLSSGAYFSWSIIASWGSMPPLLTGQILSGNIFSWSSNLWSQFATGSSGEISTGSSLGVFTGIVLPPNLVLTLQSPTNATLSAETFICRNSDCRINLTIASTFTGSYKISDFSCYFGTWETLDLDSDCNPGTYYFSQPGEFTIVVESRTNTGERLESTYEVVFDIPVSSEEQTSENTTVTIASSPPSIDTGNPTVIIDLDWQFRDYYEEIGDNTLNCYVLTCAINLTAENSVDPEQSPLTFFWRFWPTDTSNKRDPGERKYGVWEHRIILEVRDRSGNTAKKEFLLHVLWPRLEGVWEISKNKKKISPPKKEQNMKNPQNPDVFSSPTLVLQSKSSDNKSYSGISFCRTTGKTCSFNFSLSWVVKGYTYEWSLPDGEVIDTENPRSFSIPIGRHSLALTVTEKITGEQVYREMYSLEVLSVATPKKKKASVNTNIVKKASLYQSGSAYMPDVWNSLLKDSHQDLDEEVPLPYSTLYLSLGSLVLLLFRRKIFTTFE